MQEDEAQLVQSALDFNDVPVQKLLTHRVDLVAVDIHDSLDSIRQVVLEERFTRIPVYDGNIDHVIGILQSRDFLEALVRGGEIDLRSMLTEPLFVHKTKTAASMLAEFKRRKAHIAIVTDDYGGTMGIVTMEDLLEEIVGNIYDEFDPKEEQDITPLSDGRYRVAGGVDLETLSEALDIELPLDEEYSTLGGLVFSHLTQIPADGARPVVECCGLRISVTEIADRRVEWAIVEKLPGETKTEEE